MAKSEAQSVRCHMEGLISFSYNKYNGVNENSCFLPENLKPSGTSPLHTALSLCRLELERNGKDLVFLLKISVYSEEIFFLRQQDIFFSLFHDLILVKR